MSRIELTPPFRALSALALVAFGTLTAEARRMTAAELEALSDKFRDVTSVSGTYSGSATHNTCKVEGLFDNDEVNNTGRWLGKFTDNFAYAIYTFTEAETISAYRIVNAPPDKNSKPAERVPKDFKIYGSNDYDGSSGFESARWTELDSETETGWSAGEERYYMVDKPGAYKSYCIYVTALNGPAVDYAQLSEWDLYRASDLEITSLTVAGSPAAYGVSAPVYGTAMFDVTGEPTAFELAGGVELAGEEGLWLFSAAGDTRVKFLGATYAPAHGAAEEIAATSFSRTLTGSATVTWNFGELRHRLIVRAGAGGSVSADGVAAGAITNWYPAGAEVEISALAGASAEFSMWTGLAEDVLTPTMTLTMDAPHEVLALFTPVTQTLEFDSRAYITDGLVVHCDGKDNAGYGVHDNAATKWTDLSGHGNDIVNAVDSGYVWGWNENGYTNLDYTSSGTFTNGEAIAGTFKPYIPGLSLDLRRITLEGDFDAIVEGNTSASIPIYANGYIFCLPGVGFSATEALVLCIDGNNNMRALGTADQLTTSFAPNLVYNRPRSIIFRELSASHYQADKSWKDMSAQNGVTYASPAYEGDAYVLNKEGSSYYRGELRTLRLYNRSLSKWEAEWNAFVDMVRYHGVEPDTANVIHTYGSLPANYGTPDTPYGTGTVADGTVKDYSAASILATSADDGARIAKASLGAGLRARFLGWTLHCGNVVASGSEELARVKLTNCRSWFTWDFERQVRISATASEGGVVRIADGESASGVDCWCREDADGFVTLTAAPADDDHVFQGWSGDIGAADPKALVLTVPTDAARSVFATFVDKEHKSVKLTWKGSVASGVFSDPANWVEGAVPQEGDEIYITNAVSANVSVTIDAKTPRFLKFVVCNPSGDAHGTATVVLSGWETCLAADEVTVGTGGVITHAGPYKTAETASRVWIAADTLTVAAGGRISADGVGYAGNERGLNLAVEGYGPAWWLDHAIVKEQVAPVHAGVYRYGTSGGGRILPYGDPVCPVLPGSGGSTETGHAGGAIKLDVAGTLTVDGAISANAAMSANCSNGGTGGSVWITCKSVTGSGTVQANAKHCSLATGLQKRYVGGAGRVAVHYDPAEQAKEANCTIRFEALASVHYNPVDIYSGKYGPDAGQTVQDNILASFHEEGLAIQGLGSLYFTDDAFLKAESYRRAGWRFGGELFTGSPITDLVFDEPMTFDKCQLVVREPGLKVTANAGLKVFGTGYYARREMGVAFSNATVTVNGPLTIAGSRFGVSDGTLTVNGDVVQTNAVFAGAPDSPYLGGELVAHAGPTNAPNSYGAKVTVNGDWTLGSGGVVHVTCEPDNGAISKINANGKLTVASGARVDSDMGGYRIGPGSSQAASPAPTHGGRGSSGGSDPKEPYDSEREPVMPGSGAGYVSGNCYTLGGGVVLLEVAGTLTLDGTISADSNRKWGARDLAPGSGGSVNIRALRLCGNGTISASGGVSSSAGGNSPVGALKNGRAAGGGGRIAVRVNPYGCGWTDEMKANNAYSRPGPRVSSYPNNSWPVIPDEPIWDAEPGTVWWGKWGLGTMILVR